MIVITIEYNIAQSNNYYNPDPVEDSKKFNVNIVDGFKFLSFSVL